MDSEREFILTLFRNRGLRAGGIYPLPDFLGDIDFDGDPNRADAKRKAFKDLVRENAISETSAAIKLTEHGYLLTRLSETTELAQAIRELGDRLVTAKDAELAQMRGLMEVLTGISTHLCRISEDLRVLLPEKKN
jgi:hypothetical protein